MRITCILILLFLFGISSYAQNDCPDAIIVCGDANYFDLEAQGAGENDLEINPDNACASGENNSIWLKIQINQGGTLGFVLTPEENDMVIDFDFWLFGPIDDCDVIGTAIRCSTTNPLQAGLNYITTGLNATETDVSEGPGPDGNAFVQWINVLDNEFYYLVVDRPHGFGNFSMEWTGTATFHAIPVFLNPNNIPLDIEQCDKDGVNDESTTFDLTVYETMFIGTQNPVAITYHDNLNGAITGQDPILVPETYANVTNPQTIYLRMTNTVTGCYSTHLFNIEVTLPMTTGFPVDIILCDTNKNGMQEFDLSQNDTNVRSGNPATTTVTYHTSAADALSGDNPVGPLFTNTIPYGQTIWTRLEDEDGCFSYDFNTFDVIVQPLPFFNNPDNITLDIIQCDSDGVNDNTSVFDLSTHAGLLIDSQNDVAITYYLTATDAETGNNPITNPQAYSNISDPQIIYMRIFNTVTACYDTLPFTIGIERIPTGIPNNLALCDIDENGFREFDLFENNDPVLGAETGIVTFYTSEDDARNGINPIGTNYTNAVAYTTETIWARLQKDIGTCVGYGVVSFTISVIPLPGIRNPENISFDMVKCDLDGVDDDSTAFELTMHQLVMKGEQLSIALTYHETPIDAENGNNPIINAVDYSNTTNPQTIYIRLFDTATQCYKTGSFQISILPAPEITPQPPLLVCDVNNDGHANFNLDAVIQQITNDLGTATVTMHVTADDALFGVNAILDTADYQNINAETQTLYIRAESALECIDIETLQLIASPIPEATTPTVYPLCDDGANDTDGEATFDLSTKIDEILGDLDPAQYTVSFYENVVAANAGTPQILNPLSYDSTNRTVFARVTNNTTGCYDIVSFELIVNPLPVLITYESRYSLCDITPPANDEKEIFDLTSKIPDYIADQNGVVVSYHHSFADANANANAIANPEAYQNQTPGVETIFMRFTIEDTGCYRIGFLDVRALPLPIILEPTQDELTVCDTNSQGIGEFDLEALVEGMINGDVGLSITFHETPEDAQNGVNAIPNPESYVNLVTPQSIWVRVIDAEFGCYNTFILTLIVEPAPQSPPLEDLTYCDDTDNNGQNATRQVDLTVQTLVIAAAFGIDPVEDIPSELIVEYYTTQTAADAGTNKIINPSAFMGTDGQQIWVRVEDPATGCYSLEDFLLHINKPHALTTPTPLVECDEALPNNGFTEFNLTEKNNDILGPLGIGQGYTVNYYTSPKNDGDLPIATPEAYTNVVAGAQTLVVEVITTEGCKSYTTLTIRVLPLPTPKVDPEPLVLCDDNNSPDGVEVFDLTTKEAEIAANGSNYIFSYYTDPDDATQGINPIADPTAYQSGTGQVYVRVELETNNPTDPGCYHVVILELIVNPLPPIADLKPMTRCEQDTTQTYEFDIQGYVNDALGTTGNYDVDFFEDAALTTPAAPITAYPVTGTATVYVRVVNLDTDCTITKELILNVEQEAIAYPVTPLAIECDYDGANDGIITTWDLTQAQADVLGSQDPAVYIVTYHTTEQDALEGINAIATPEAYTNLTPIQTIWIRVTNSATQQPCSDVIDMEITTELLPIPEITGGTICVDMSTGAVVRPLLINTNLDATHSFEWFLDGELIAGETGPSLLAQAAGSYTVIATSANGCVSDLAGPAVVIRSGSAVKIGRGYYVTNYFSDNQTITVTVEGYGNYEYSLDQGPWQTDPVFTNVSPGSHTVRVRDTNPGACDELVITDASIVDYPNFFTPNGDGFHDTWNIIGLEQEDAKIYIFDRYGKFIKQISAVGEGWDGTFNGKNLPATDYWFSVTYGEFDGTITVIKEFRAHFSLLR